MPSPTNGAEDSGRPTTPEPALTPRLHLDAGFRYEQAGLARRAIAAYEAALGAGGTTLERADAHLRLARVHRSESDWDAAALEARVAMRLAKEGGSDDLAAEAMNVEVGVHQLRGEFDAADALALAALTLARAPRVRGILLQNRGAVAAQRGDFAAASALFAESVDAFQQSGYELGMAIALNNASAAARDAGDPAAALDLAIRAASLSRRLSAFDILTLAVQNQAHALVALGRADEAEAPLGEVLGHFTATCNVLRQAECLEVMGSLYALQPRDAETAARCFELARSLADRVGSAPLAQRVTRRLIDMKSLLHGSALAGISAGVSAGLSAHLSPPAAAAAPM
jgi:tetratricopeptide (TPR) repeat protein